MKHAIRRRTVELRELDDREGVLTGYATLYDQPYEIAPGVTETITRGAFDRALAAVDGIVPVFWNHGWAKTNATPIGHAVLRGDGRGVQIQEAILYTDDPEVNRIWQAARNRALREWSLGFRAQRIRRRNRGKDELVEAGEVIELSVVIRGAAFTEMHVRSEADLVALREAEAEAGVEVVEEEDPPAENGDEPTENEEQDPPAEGEPGSDESEGEADDKAALREQAYGLLSRPGVRRALAAAIKDNNEEN